MNNRELAILIWLVILAFTGLLFNTTRKSEIQVFRSFLQLIAQPAFILIFSYQEIVLALLFAEITRFDLTWWLLKDYLIIFITVIIGYLGHFKSISYRNKLLKSIGLAALINFLLNNFTFSLMHELFFIPVLLLLVMLQVALENQHALSIAHLIDIIFIFVSAGMIIFTLVKICLHPLIIFSFNFWSSFLLESLALLANFPLILTSNILYDFDQIDNYLTEASKTSLLLFFQIFKYYALKVGFQIFTGKQALNIVLKVEQRGPQNRYFRITIPNGSTVKDTFPIIHALQVKLLPRNYYSKQITILPISIRIQDESQNILNEWEIPHLLKEYQRKRLFFYDDF